MRLTWIIPALLVAGCAAPVTREQVRAAAARAPDYRLCSSVMVDPPAVAEIAQDEIRRRGLNCAPYAEAIARQINGQRAANAAAMNQALRMMQGGQPAPSGFTNCTTRSLGGTLQTTCY